jgi:hypothetical protein
MDIPRELDRKWHNALIAQLPWSKQQQARDGYKQVFNETWESLPDDQRRENAAARAANIRLREFAEKLIGRQAVERITAQATKR